MDAVPYAKPSTSGETPHGGSPAKEAATESDTDQSKTAVIPSEDTLSSGSSDALPKVPFK